VLPRLRFVDAHCPLEHVRSVSQLGSHQASPYSQTSWKEPSLALVPQGEPTAGAVSGQTGLQDPFGGASQAPVVLLESSPSAPLSPVAVTLPPQPQRSAKSVTTVTRLPQRMGTSVTRQLGSPSPAAPSCEGHVARCALAR
jgi:hypothetical protein